MCLQKGMESVGVAKYVTKECSFPETNFRTCNPILNSRRTFPNVFFWDPGWSLLKEKQKPAWAKLSGHRLVLKAHTLVINLIQAQKFLKIVFNLVICIFWNHFLAGFFFQWVFCFICAKSLYDLGRSLPNNFTFSSKAKVHLILLVYLMSIWKGLESNHPQTYVHDNFKVHC